MAELQPAPKINPRSAAIVGNRSRGGTEALYEDAARQRAARQRLQNQYAAEQQYGYPAITKQVCRRPRSSQQPADHWHQLPHGRHVCVSVSVCVCVWAVQAAELVRDTPVSERLYADGMAYHARREQAVNGVRPPSSTQQPSDGKEEKDASTVISGAQYVSRAHKRFGEMIRRRRGSDPGPLSPASASFRNRSGGNIFEDLFREAEERHSRSVVLDETKATTASASKLRLNPCVGVADVLIDWG